jgi:spermidine/putrescine transport system permease protein
VNEISKTERALPWMLVTPALLWTLLFFVAPFVAMALLSLNFQAEGGMTVSNYSQFFANPSYYRAMLNSLEVTGLVTLISVLLAYPFAWILAEQIPQRLQRLALLLAILPFWTSYVVRSYSWLLVLAQNGVVNDALLRARLVTEPLQLANTRTATVIGFVHFFVMLDLTISPLKQLNPSYRKAAADGAGPIHTFIHVVLPSPSRASWSGPS